MYKITLGDTQFTAFDYSGEATSVVLIIMDTEDFDYQHYSANTASYKYLAFVSPAVAFSSGKATKNASDGTPVGF